MKKAATFLSTVLLILAACSGGSGSTLVASSPGTIGLGQQRVLVALISNEGEEIASPDLALEVEFSRTAPAEVVGTVPTRFIWTIPDVRGLYVAEFSFDRPGSWQAKVTVDGRSTTPYPIEVVADSVVPEVGEKAPPSVTRTGAAFPLEEITTDPSPDPAFYQLSLHQAFASGRPSVVVFSTPAFCETQICGPTLDLAKAARPRWPHVNFIHVEVYENLDAVTVAELRPVPAVLEWGLPSEPWVFVVGADGRVAARFEGTFSDSELDEALVSTQS